MELGFNDQTVSKLCQKGQGRMACGQNPHMNPPVAAVTHYENFPVASILCPAHLRAPIAAIYHFARTADDLADEGDATPTQRLEDLRAYGQALTRATQDPTPYPTGERWAGIFAPLQAVVMRHKLPVQLLHDLLDAFAQDVRMSAQGAWYPDQAALLDYCRRSANPIGRLLLHLYGVHAPKALARSDDICSALQLINFWQDLSQDIPRRRYYLTQQDCQRLGISPADIEAGRSSPSTIALIAEYVSAARARMQNGAALVHQIPGRAGWELRLVVQGGLRILDKIEALGFATLHTRPRLHATDYALMLWRAAWM
jgi:hydroxysqualene synthase